MPRRGVGAVALAAAIVAALVEFSQLVRTDGLDAFRGTPFGALLLGRTFSWWDIPWYWLGIGTAALLAAMANGRLLTRARKLR